jgi:hypothetical protein
MIIQCDSCRALQQQAEKARANAYQKQRDDRHQAILDMYHTGASVEEVMAAARLTRSSADCYYSKAMRQAKRWFHIKRDPLLM